ncbi:MAG TPA: hypothetical protein VGA13_11875 [Acidimicrobiales bacterium]
MAALASGSWRRGEPAVEALPARFTPVAVGGEIVVIGHASRTEAVAMAADAELAWRRLPGHRFDSPSDYGFEKVALDDAVLRVRQAEGRRHTTGGDLPAR